MIISISGLPGSGKSTLAKILSEKLGWPRYYMGGLRRQRAQELGLTLEEYNQRGETDPRTDLEVDEYQKKLGATEDNFIIEGRTSWHFIPHSFKIFLVIDEKVAADFIWRDLQQDELAKTRNEAKGLDSAAAVLAANRRRLASDRIRYQKYFGIDVYDRSHYDLVIDTTKLKIPDVAEMILAKIGIK